MKILKLSHQDLIKLGLTRELNEIIADVKKAIINHGRGYSISDKVALIPDREWTFKKCGVDEETRRKYSVVDLDQKLSALNSINENAACVKIVGGNALNREKGITRSESLILIYTNDTFMPLCLMRGTEISALRTGACTAIVGEYLMPKKQDNIVAFIGSGKIAEKSLLCMDSSIANRIKEIRVYSRTIKKREGFVEEMRLRVNMNLSVADSIDEAVRGADYIVTATTALKPLVYDHQLKRNVTLLLLGGDEVGTNYLKRCYEKGLIFCDDWELVKHRNVQSLPLLYHKLKETGEKDESFRIKDSKIINLWKLITGRFSIKQAKYECIHVNCVGLPCLDLEIAYRIYKKALEQGLEKYIYL